MDVSLSPNQQAFFAVADSLRSVRRFRSDPVPRALIERLLRTATMAPNGANRQTWRFLVITSAAMREKLAQLYVESLVEQRGKSTLVEVLAEPGISHTLRESVHLASHFAEIPVHIAVCDAYAGSFTAGPSIYPACQNLMLAAWALGLGTVITTVWKRREPAIRALLAIPNEYQIAAIIPLGWPARPYGPPRRKPVAEVTFWDRWGGSEPAVDTLAASQ